MKNNKLNYQNLTKQEINLIKKTLIHEIRPLKYIHTAIKPSNYEELHKAYIYTIKKHSLEKELEGFYLKGAFWKLAKFDKINTRKNKPFLMKLDRLFHALKRHMQLKKIVENANPFSTVRTTYSTHSTFIQPIINAYETTLDDNKKNNSINNKIKIFNVYKEDPLSISMVIQASLTNEYDFLFEGIDKKDFKDLSKRIVTYKLKLSKKELSKSLQLHIVGIYKNDSIHNQLLKNISIITNNTLIQCAKQISKKFIDEDTKGLNPKNINAKVNHIEYFKDIVIMQPTIKKTKEPKINSYKELISNPK